MSSPPKQHKPQQPEVTDRIKKWPRVSSSGKTRGTSHAKRQKQQKQQRESSLQNKRQQPQQVQKNADSERFARSNSKSKMHATYAQKEDALNAQSKRQRQKQHKHKQQLESTKSQIESLHQKKKKRPREVEKNIQQRGADGFSSSNRRRFHSSLNGRANVNSGHKTHAKARVKRQKQQSQHKQQNHQKQQGQQKQKQKSVRGRNDTKADAVRRSSLWAL